MFVVRGWEGCRWKYFWEFLNELEVNEFLNHEYTLIRRN